MVNRNEYDVSGPQLEIPSRPGMHYYDLWHGTELSPAVANGKATVSFDLEGLGYGAVLATEEKLIGECPELALLHGGALQAPTGELFAGMEICAPDFG